MYNVELKQGINSGTSLQGYLDIKYSTLVDIFGKANGDGDDYKVDKEWIGTINNKVFTIYNYKTGKNYLGSSGKEVGDIMDWHVGGEHKVVHMFIQDYINKYIDTIKVSERQWQAHDTHNKEVN